MVCLLESPKGLRDVDIHVGQCRIFTLELESSAIAMV